MADAERDPVEVADDSPGDSLGDAPGHVLRPRTVPLGGLRAMTVRRTLPSRERSLIGPWCLIDHFGPDDVAASGGMQVPGHPHTGLQTLTWLFSGEVEHRDTTGAVALASPGTMTLMTAGVGVAHSEFSTPSTSVLRGIQLWIALPKAYRFTQRAFEVCTPDSVAFDCAQVRVLLGRLGRHSSPARCFSSLVAAEVLLPPGRSVTCPHGSRSRLGSG